MSVLVVGGVNMDLGARPHRTMIPGDSNPGRVQTSSGGVGFNIARNLRLLGVDTALLTVWGEDSFAGQIRQEAAQMGLKTDLCARIPGGRTGTYFYLLDEKGDMAAAVNDMEIYDRITPAFLARRMDRINAFSLVIFDTNIPRESVEYLCKNCTVPLLADPVSTIKGEKLRGLTGSLYAIKPNRAEAAMLTGESEPEKMAEKLLETGVQQVYLSLSVDGVYAASAAGERCYVPCPRVEIANATGGGDAMVAAIAAGLCRGDGLSETAKNAIAAGAFACTAATTIHPDMSWENIRKIRESEENI